MLASELIKELQKIIDDKGDAIVKSVDIEDRFYNGFAYVPVEIDSLEFSSGKIFINLL